MNEQLLSIAERIRGLRDLMEVTPEEMAGVTGMTVEEYLEHENGTHDFSFTFLFKVANRLRVDITDLMTGEMPRLSMYTLTRKGEGLPIERRKGFGYLSLAHLFKNKLAEPFYVTAKYDPELVDAPIHLSQHDGQEMDFVLEGELRMKIEDHEFVMKAGDCVYYDSAHGHGMVAFGGKDCKFLAIVMKGQKDGGSAL